MYADSISFQNLPPLSVGAMYEEFEEIIADASSHGPRLIWDVFQSRGYVTAYVHIRT